MSRVPHLRPAGVGSIIQFMTMKKWIAALAAAAVLTGCGTPTDTAETVDQPETPAVTITNQVDIKTLEDPADLSGYQWLEDSSPAFTEISLQESIRMFSEGGSGIVVFSAETCPWCNRAIPVLNEVLKENGLKAYYVDTNQPIASDAMTSKQLYDELCSYISSIFELDDNGQPSFQIPEVIAVKDGTIVGHHLSLVDSFVMSDADVQLDDAQRAELKQIYQDLINACAD